ncbi:Ornithine decarboxylase [Glutinoglossum americanum]|uniref:ornithine decarboxylase n=1 Tax=Glutinoglossum americanum TaxID=1670608 RepID=A0A9P8I2Q3_9PEZI|nr:Ornithine decarboxylase [Glutinoglossum americanum]
MARLSDASTQTQTTIPAVLPGVHPILRKNARAHCYKDGTKTPEQLISDVFRNRVESIDHDQCDAGDEDAFFVADLGEVYRQHIRWKMNLKRVKPFYAIKCNPDPQVVRLLAELGTGFDCASKNEIQQVLDMGIDPSRIIYAQPCKTKSYVRYAAKMGVRKMTFDNPDELYKTKQFFPEAELFLRIATDDTSSLCRLSLKFGASLDCTRSLLELAKQLGLNVVGVSFHVGSGASDPNAFLKAVRDSRAVFDQASEVGFSMAILDVGGGFCSDLFEPMACVLSQALDDYFPPNIRVIGEPGRYYVASAFTLACNVIARRTIEDATTQTSAYMLYLNDGIYGNFTSIMFDHQHPVPRILRCGKRFLHGSEASEKYGTGPATVYSIWGPTCDGIDLIVEKAEFPEVIDIGDWIYFEEMGGLYTLALFLVLLNREFPLKPMVRVAYTKCSATRFNGFTDNHEVLYVSSEPGAAALLGFD